VGDAFRVEDSSGVLLRNNVFWSDSGSDLYAAASGQPGLTSDSNLFYRGATSQGNTGFWNNAAQAALADWQAASGQDAHSLAVTPGFVDIDGADNVLGYSSAGAGYDGGQDDNFTLMKGAPGIDHGDSFSGWATDNLGASRADDPGAANAGTPDYAIIDPGSSLFTQSGSAASFRTNNTYYSFKLPFAFPFYGSDQMDVFVSTEGFLQFGKAAGADDNANSDSSLIQSRRIAPLWDNLRTTDTGNDIYVDSTTAGQVKFTWKATNEADATPVNVSVVLFQDGQIRFDYGAGNSNLTPTIGISMGDAQHYLLAPNNNAATLTNAHSVQFKFVPGIVDIGAYEFQGSSLDAVPPTVVKAGAIVAGTPDAPANQIQITFSEPLNVVDANASANYDLREAGPNGIFNDGDDAVITLTPHYTSGAKTVLLDTNLTTPALPPGRYQLTVRGDSLHDSSGLKLDGDANGSEGGNDIRSNRTPVLSLIPSQSVTQSQRLEFAAAATDPDQDHRSFTLGPGAPAGAVLTPDGAFSWTPPAAQPRGVYNVAVVVTDDAAFALTAAQIVAVRVTRPAEAPGVLSTAVNGGAVQRSTVTSLTLQFNDNVAASLAGADLVLRDLKTGADLPVSALSIKYDPLTNRATVTFPGLVGQKLPDGSYQLTVKASGVTDARGTPLAADFTYRFTALTGDVNGDGAVNDFDYYDVWQNLLKPPTQRNLNADVDGDGQVTAADLAIVKTKYLTVLRGSP
jgi:hypothetical protein